jgi:DNA modification methylase
MSDKQKQLFKTKFVPGKAGSGNLFEEEFVVDDGPVECLGMTFENDELRREYFLEKLHEKLKDPEFRKIEGFPIGEDEDILALSDPPYYTACPNPFIEEFIAHYGKPYNPDTDDYRREPFAADVSEGKYDPLYRMHPYHTKVPHKAIMRYILHYTEPGDVVFDSFCGTGMTGVAAHMCGDRDVVTTLGYQVKSDGTILREETDEDDKKTWVAFSMLGVRRSVLNDLSPAATFIAYNYNSWIDVVAFKKEAMQILRQVEKECGWMYETRHNDGKKGKINYVIWSDVFVCPECASEIVFWENAVDIGNGKVLEQFQCPKCTAGLSKRNVEHSWSTSFDTLIGKTVTQAKQVPVRISYTVGGKRVDKVPDAEDIGLIQTIVSKGTDNTLNPKKIPDGDKTGEPIRVGLTYVHQLYTTRNYNALAKFRRLSISSRFWFVLSVVAFRITKRYGLTYQSGIWGAGGGPTNGTYYIPSLMKELNIIRMLEKALNKFESHYSRSFDAYISSQSASKFEVRDNSLDYIFIDPPFGSNLMYSELNLVWETWLNVFTNNEEEAVENKTQKKGLPEYRQIMTDCFKEAYRKLKPGRWMTVEFSNTKASVWNNIQTAITDAGFVVANVSSLDKKKGSFNAQTNPTSVKQDLVISAYKPNGGFEERFQREATMEEGVWDFVRTHLKYVPVTKRQGTILQLVSERDPRILFDQMVSYYVRKGYPVPISSQEFQTGLAQRFIERDGMFFLSEQAAEYDRKKMTSGEAIQASLFVSDEASAIQWLKQQLTKKPQTFQDINPLFMKEIGGWQKHEKALELSELLEQNFLRYDGKDEVPSQIHSYLSSNFKELRKLDKDDPALRAKGKDRWYVPDPKKAGDLEKLRERALMREFEVYRESKQKRLKVFRLEAVRAGFKKAWQERDYGTIIAVARKIPDKILQEDPKLLMWYDQAVTRMGEE